MANPKGVRLTGTRLGVPNKKTQQHIREAGKRVAEARKLGRKQAVDVLDDLMNTAMAMAAKYQPATSDHLPRDDAKFLQWIQTAGLFAKNLAEFQTPKFRAVMIQTPPSLGDAEITIDQKGNILEIDDPKKLARVYAQMVRRVG